MICGSCGKPMRTNYHTDQRPAYECSGRADRLTTPTCRSIAASTVDEAVTELLLNALSPNEIALALAADRAQRAFQAVEPDNRLVARSLETRWEAKLAALAEAEQALAAARDTLPPLPERAELEKLAPDLPGLWHAPTTSNKDRKRLLRTVISDITPLPEPDHGKARIGIRWHTGASDELRVDRAVHPGTAVRSPSPAVDMVTRLGPTTGTDEMVGMLNAAGMTTGHGRPFDAKAVQWIRHAYHIPAPNPYAAGEISVADAAERLGVTSASSTTGSRPANSTRAAAPAAGSASPGPTASRPNADAALPNPAISTHRPDTADPALGPERPTMSAPAGIIFGNQRRPAPQESDAYTQLQEGTI